MKKVRFKRPGYAEKEMPVGQYLRDSMDRAASMASGQRESLAQEVREMQDILCRLAAILAEGMNDEEIHYLCKPYGIFEVFKDSEDM